VAYEIKRFPFPGTIDADGHVLEPPDLWENYLEAEFKARALRIRVDDEGYEYLEIDQRPSTRTVKGCWASRRHGPRTAPPDRRYQDNMPFGRATRRAPRSSSRRISTARCSTQRSACSGSASSPTRS
jgi:hypothetical protein